MESRRNKIKHKFNNLLTTEENKKSLNKTVGYYKGKKEFFMVQEVAKARDILIETRRTSEYHKTVLTCLGCAILGALIGLFMKNIIAIPVLAIGMFMIPLWKLKMYQSKYKKYIAMQLESCVSLITTAYMRNNNIINAVEENMTNISSLVRPYFEEFVAEYKVDANMKNCIYSLQNKVTDNIFKEWCECLAKTYDNSDMKENLMSIANKYSSVRIVQDELDAETASSLVEYIIMLAVLVFSYPMIRFLNPLWFTYFATIPGKICVAYSMVVFLFSVKRLIDITTPVQFER
jgi:tight adherence protein B